MDYSGAVAVGGHRTVGYALKWGDTLDYAVRFVVHDGDVEEADIGGCGGSLMGKSEVGILMPW